MLMVYGFGSYFNSQQSYNDIDILIVHETSYRGDCVEAIELKRDLAAKLDQVSVSILSASAEVEFKFIESSQAVFLAAIDGAQHSLDIDGLVAKIVSFR